MSDQISKPSSKIVFEIQNRDGEPFVSARQLHENLEIKKDFSDWIKNQIETLGFVEGEEFSPFRGRSENGRETIEYALGFDAAKHVAMASRTQKGREIRQWFIDFEKQSRIVPAPAFDIPKTYADALRLAAAQAEALEEKDAIILNQELVIEQQQPAVDFVEAYVKADGLFTIRETSKVLGIQQGAFIDMCLSKKVLFRESGRLCSYTHWTVKGYTQVKTGVKNGHAFSQTRFTSIGIHWVREYLSLDRLLPSVL